MNTSRPSARSLLALGLAWLALASQLPGPASEATHWAYVPPERPPLPAAEQGWARNGIDHFTGAAMRAAGLVPSPEADRARLARRVSLDLTGLPPAPEDVRVFLGDESEGAYERWVERLLASPHYGEHQARFWLDLARYADSHGYEKDGSRSMWRWRDWVIEAFNDDVPFDRFTVLQLAGDLLPDATQKEILATGFHRNTMINQEGGVDPEEFRVAAVVDRVNTTAEVWLGTTLACAQCHDHKFDPFTQKEYFELFAFFDGTEDIGPDAGPTIEAPTKAQLAERPQLEAEALALEEQLTVRDAELDIGLEAWEAAWKAQRTSWRVLALDTYSAMEGTRLSRLADDSLLAFGDLPATDTYTVGGTVSSGALRALRLEVLTDPSLPGGGPGRPSHGNFVLNELELFLAAPGTAAERVALSHARADFSQNDYAVAGIVDGDERSGWAIGGGLGSAHQVVFELGGLHPARKRGTLTARLRQEFGSGHLIGRFRLSVSALTPPRDGPVPTPDIERLIAKGGVRSPQEHERVRTWYRERSPALDSVRARLASLREQLRAPSSLVMKERTQPRDTRVHVRGSFLNPGESVQPDVPLVLGALPQRADGRRPDRLDFARWVASTENPLTARVTVNRVWARLFGRGLVPTVNNFGTQGEPPTHRELLDWLAIELVERGWSMKEMLRLIVTSATYRQTSNASPAALAADPGNVWLARFPRQRVDGETVRDIALVVSGRLAPVLGGPSVYPRQPEGTWAMTYSGDRWVTSEGDDRYRRGLYTFWRRTAPYPTFQIFDAPSRELCTSARPRSDTPLQALALLNDPAFIELAGGLAQRLVNGADSVRERVELGFQLCVTRAARPSELDVLERLYESERAAFASDPDDAARLVEAARVEPMDPGYAASEMAAWVVVANILLNLDETITKG